MDILWAGGEDFDFPNGATPTVVTTTSYRRSAGGGLYFGRCALQAPTGGTIISTVFPGGPITSGWLSLQFYIGTTPTMSNLRCVGLGNSGMGGRGLYIGFDSAATGRLALYTWDGTTASKLASEFGASLAYATMTKLDMHLQSYGGSATVDVYVNGASSPVIHFVGSTSVNGVSDLDCVVMFGITTYGGYMGISELIVADEDTRALNLATLAPSAAGDSDQWTGAYTDINEVTLNDATVNYVDSNGQVQQYALTDLPAGAFLVKALVLTARATKSSDASVGNLKLGLKSGGSADDGSSQALSTAWQTFHRILATNPITSNIFSTTEVNALQSQLKSAA